MGLSFYYKKILCANFENEGVGFMKHLSLKNIISICGACIAFYIGAGFATMQEILQYEASYGSRLWIVIAVAAVIYIYTNLSFACNGSRFKLVRGGDIYAVYCGKHLGAFFDWFSAVFCYMSFIVMCGGANSTMTEQWGVPNGIGAVVLAVCVTATAVFGLDGILKALGKLGPVIIALILFVSATTAISSADKFNVGLAMIDSNTYDIAQVGNGNPVASGASYGGFVILWFASFLAEIGAKNKLREVNLGMLMSSIFIFGAAALCCIALICNIDSVWNTGIPALALATAIHPLLAEVFAAIIFIGIYTTSVPLLWTGVRIVAPDGSSKYKLLILVGGVLGCVIACFFPYKVLLNVLYGLNGYLGFCLILFMIVNDLKIVFSISKINK